MRTVLDPDYNSEEEEYCQECGRVAKQNPHLLIKTFHSWNYGGCFTRKNKKLDKSCIDKAIAKIDKELKTDKNSVLKK